MRIDLGRRAGHTSDVRAAGFEHEHFVQHYNSLRKYAL